ncbi:zinc finger protein 37-like [Branchiostoma floridae]|uniref:Zinc finger protein 37-like n=1 Tax=Branchiostoma floridae TaxID=7739 RepID=A0A9J7HMV9_BRAFL|nr:zinc finger protein 37-like [Branchiostoma floridae]
MSGQQEFICGLSRVVTIAVLPRLNTEELMFELNRRIQNLDKENSIKDRLVSILRDVMLEEYRVLERRSEMTIPEQEQETVTIHENIPTTYAETMSSETSSSDPCTSLQSSGLEIAPSCVPTPDHCDVRIKMECNDSEDDQIGQRLNQPERCDNVAGFINSGYEQSETINTEIATLPFYEPTPGQDCENRVSILSSKNSGIIDTKRYVCDECGFKTSYALNLSRHRQLHKKDEPFMCDECGYKARDKHQLDEHMRTHTGEKSFRCNECGYKTSYKRSVVRHMKKHASQKPYRWELYECQSQQNADIEKHMINHAGVKLYKCEECDYSTARKPDFTRHRRCHTGERPYSCQECDYKAKHKFHLVKHMRIKHQ